MSKDFFKRKEALELNLPSHGGYEPTNMDNDMHACGITDIEGFQARHNQLFLNLVVDSNSENPVATLAKKIEEHFTFREVAFLMSKDLLIAAYNNEHQKKQKQN